MKLFGFVLAIILCCSLSASAQFRNNVNSNPRPSVKRDNGDAPERRWYFGGGGGLGGGTDYNGYRYFYYSILPVVGYRVTNSFSVGTGLSYQHYSYPDVNVKLNQYGVSPFARYNFNQLFFQVEYQNISAPLLDNTGRRSYDRLLLGVGYSAPVGKHGSINAMIMYDVLYKQPSVFNSPIVPRVFILF